MKVGSSGGYVKTDLNRVDLDRSVGRRHQPFELGKPVGNHSDPLDGFRTLELEHQKTIPVRMNVPFAGPSDARCEVPFEEQFLLSESDGIAAQDIYRENLAAVLRPIEKAVSGR